MPWLIHFCTIIRLIKIRRIDKFFRRRFESTVNNTTMTVLDYKINRANGFNIFTSQAQ
jgi:hypothetical protein